MSFSGAAGSQLPLANNILPDSTVATDRDMELNQVLDLFRPPAPPGQGSPTDFAPFNSFTMTDRYRGVNTKVTSLTREFWVDSRQGDWPWLFSGVDDNMPMNSVITILEARNSAMTPAPEGSAAPWVELAANKRATSMQRWHMGAHAFLDPLLSSDPTDGINFVKMQLRTVVNSAWITAVNIIKSALICSPQTWYIPGANYVNIMQAQLPHTSIFGIINTDPQAIYKLNSHANALTQGGVGFTDVVFYQNTLDFVALGNGFETEAYRRGEVQANKNLVGAGKAISLVLASMGVTAHEDRIISVNNLPRAQQDYLSCRTSIGAFHVFDASTKIYDHRIHAGTARLNMDATMSGRIRSLDIDGMKEIKPAFLIKNCMRYSADGNDYSAWMQRFAKDPVRYARKNGFDVRNTMIDPHIFSTGAPTIVEDPSGAGQTAFAAASGLSLLGQWGDTETFFRSTEDDAEHGRTGHAYFQSVLGNSVLAAASDLVLELEKLYNPPSLDAGVIGLQILMGSENAKSSGNMASSGRWGVPENTNFVDAAGDLGFNDGTNDLKLYAVYLDTATSIRPDTIAGVGAGGVSATLGGTAGAASASIPLPQVPLSRANMPVMYRLDTAAGILAWRKSITDEPVTVGGSAEPTWGSTGYRVGQLLQKLPANWTAAQATQYLADKFPHGLGRVEAIKAPKLPYGMSTLAHAYQLKDNFSAHVGYNDRSTDTEVVNFYARLTAGLEAIDKLYNEVNLIYPYVRIDEKYVPYYISTSDSALNRKLSWFENTFSLSRSKEPLFVRALSEIVGGSTSRSINTLTASVVGTVPTRLGISATDKTEISRLVLVTPTAAASAQLDRVLERFINSEYLTPATAVALQEKPVKRIAELADAFATSGLAADYLAEYNASRAPTAAAGLQDGFRVFFTTEIQTLLALGSDDATLRAEKVFAGIAGLIDKYLAGERKHYVLNRNFVNRMVANLTSKRSAERSAQGGSELDAYAAAGTAVVEARDQFVNTRSSINRKYFTELSSTAETGGRVSDRVYLANLPVRPADPSTPQRPLYSTILNASKFGVVADQRTVDSAARAHVTAMKHAHAPFSKNAGVYASSFSIFNGMPLYATMERGGEPASKVRARDEYLASRQGTQEARHRPADESFLFSGGDAALLTQQDYTTASGDILPERTSFERNRNLLYRIGEVGKNLRHPVELMCAIMFLMSKANANSQYVWLKHGLLLPETTYSMYHADVAMTTSPAIYFRRGGSCCKFGSKWEDATEQLDGSHKEVTWNFTAWMSAVVLDERNFLIIPHVKIEEYHRGLDDLVYDHPDQFNPEQPVNYRSCFVFSHGSVVNRSYFIAHCNPMPLAGRHVRRNFGDVSWISQERIFQSSNALWPGAYFYGDLWGFARYSEVNSSLCNPSGTYNDARKNFYVTCEAYAGSMDVNQVHAGDYANKIEGTGHLKDWRPPMLQYLRGTIPVKQKLAIHH